MDEQQNPESHLDHLLTPAGLDTPWFRTIFKTVREAIHPPKLAPLEVTSKPVAVAEMWGWYHGNETKAGLSSLLIHVGVVALILFLGSLKPVRTAIKEHFVLTAPDLKPFVPENKGGGGGGQRKPLEANKGKLPKIAPKQFTPPVDPIDHPKIPVVPTIVADQPIPDIVASNVADPLSRLGVPSGGSGLGGGIGVGKGGGVGPGSGPGVGPGSGGGFGGGVYKIGGGVSAPIPIFKPEPEYSEEARKAKWQGTVLLSMVVDDKGHPSNIKVVRSLGLGLDQKAIEAVERWLFKPGVKDGKPVAVQANIEINFRLL